MVLTNADDGNDTKSIREVFGTAAAQNGAAGGMHGIGASKGVAKGSETGEAQASRKRKGSTQDATAPVPSKQHRLIDILSSQATGAGATGLSDAPAAARQPGEASTGNKRPRDGSAGGAQPCVKATAGVITIDSDSDGDVGDTSANAPAQPPGKRVRQAGQGRMSDVMTLDDSPAADVLDDAPVATGDAARDDSKGQRSAAAGEAQRSGAGVLHDDACKGADSMEDAGGEAHSGEQDDAVDVAERRQLCAAAALRRLAIGQQAQQG